MTRDPSVRTGAPVPAGRRRRVIMAVTVGVLAVLPSACGGGAYGPAPAPEPQRPLEVVLAEIGEDEAYAALSADAQMLVRRVLRRLPLAELCAGGDPLIKQEMRRAVIGAMTAGDLARPRAAGTAAGQYLSARCKNLRAS